MIVNMSGLRRDRQGGKDSMQPQNMSCQEIAGTVTVSAVFYQSNKMAVIMLIFSIKSNFDMHACPSGTNLQTQLQIQRQICSLTPHSLTDLYACRTE